MKQLFIAAIASLALPALAMTAEEIMQHVDQVPEPESVKSSMSMVLVDNKGKKTGAYHAKSPRRDRWHQQITDVFP